MAEEQALQASQHPSSLIRISRLFSLGARLHGGKSSWHEGEVVPAFRVHLCRVSTCKWFGMIGPCRTVVRGETCTCVHVAVLL